MNASSGLKVTMTIGRVVAPAVLSGGTVRVAVEVGGEGKSVELRIGSGAVEFVTNIPRTSIRRTETMVNVQTFTLWKRQRELAIPGRRIDGNVKNLRFSGHRVNFHTGLVQKGRRYTQDPSLIDDL